MPTPDGDGDEDFEFLVNLLASDGADPDPGPPPLQTTGSRQVHHGLGIQRGSDGKLDLGQVKTYYEKKNTRVGTGTGIGAVTRDNPGSADPRYLRNPSGLYGGRRVVLAALAGVMWRGFRKDWGANACQL